MGKRVLVALGGNAIKKPDEIGTLEEQIRNVSIACKQIADIISLGFEVIITHGNGPQVGNLAIQQEQAKSMVPPQPLSILNAMTQGQIGHMIQFNLRNLIKENIDVVTIVTHVLVDKDDPEFSDPHKPIGPFYNEEEASQLAKEKKWVIKKILNNRIIRWRRVVPSPEPRKIIEGLAIKKMIDLGMVVIASGGGGIPVVYNKKGVIEGVNAVIDKDRSSEILAEQVEADTFLILTDVESVRLNYGKPMEKRILNMTVKEARIYKEEGHFPPGSMGPKVEACIKFVEHGGGVAIITSLDKAVEAVLGNAGTTITKI
jgi:carbamate kinase